MDVDASPGRPRPGASTRLYLPEHTHIPVSRRTPAAHRRRRAARGVQAHARPVRRRLAAAAAVTDRAPARHRHRPRRPARADRHGQGHRHPRPHQRRAGGARRRLRLERGRDRGPRRRRAPSAGPRAREHVLAMQALWADDVAGFDGRARARSNRAGRGPSRCSAGRVARAPRRRLGPQAVRPHRRVRRRLDQDRPAEHHLEGHARRVAGGRRHRPVRVGLELRPLRTDLRRTHGPCLEGWTTLAALAQATCIRVGCQVTGMPYRQPAVLANMAATVDIIRDGRLELGLGAGWNEEEGRRVRHRPAAAQGALRPLRRGCRGDRAPALSQGG